MDAKRKKRLRERQERRRKFAESKRTGMSMTQLDIQKEADYIVSCALKDDVRCVAVGPLLFFSTETGDAWMLDLEDYYAICLARDYTRQPARISDLDGKLAVEWDRTFSIEGRAFTTMENDTGRVSTILSCPIELILATIEQYRDARG